MTKAKKPYIPWMQRTEAARFSFIKSAIRKASMRYPPKYEVLNAAKVGKRINPKSGKMAEHYKCAACGQDSPASSVAVDHILPIVDVTGFSGWGEVVERLFCPPEGLQVLCLECHKKKSQEENAERRANKKSK